MKVAVIGSRSFNDMRLLESELQKYPDIELIVSGGAQGADTLAERYAIKKGISTLIFKPDYERYGRTAPLLRNKLIVDNSNLVIAFWDGKSKGTKHTVDYAKSKQIQVIQVIF